jgi:hypothetical protein
LIVLNIIAGLSHNTNASRNDVCYKILLVLPLFLREQKSHFLINRQAYTQQPRLGELWAIAFRPQGLVMLIENIKLKLSTNV